MNDSAILALAESIEKKQPAVLVTVIEMKGASPAKVGAQLTYLSDGCTTGTVGGGRLEAAILSDVRAVLNSGLPCTKHYRLVEEGNDSIGALCGGEVNVFFHPYFPPPQMVIVGGGHIGKPLETMGKAAGFDVTIVDVEPGRATVPALEAVEMTSDSYVVLITTDHVSDEAALRQVLHSPACYIGMIGSRAKCRTIFNHLLSDGYSDADLERVFAPIGLDLGGDKPNEIAVAILSEIIAVRCGHEDRRPIQFRRLQSEKSGID